MRQFGSVLLKSLCPGALNVVVVLLCVSFLSSVQEKCAYVSAKPYAN